MTHIGLSRRVRRSWVAPIVGLGLAVLCLTACGTDTANAEKQTTDTDAALSSSSASADSSGQDAGNGCSGRGVDVGSVDVLSDDGIDLSIIAASPESPIAGDNVWTIQLTKDNKALSGVAEDISVSLFMPDHGHGTPVAVGVTELQAGDYELSPVNLFMPGYWSVSVEIAMSDEASVLQFGVCVE